MSRPPVGAGRKAAALAVPSDAEARAQETLEMLRNMRMTLMATEVVASAERGDHASLDALTRVAEAEWQKRQQKSLDRRMLTAELPQPGECIGDFLPRMGRGITQDQLLDWAECRWIRDQRNFIVTGEAASGKTWLASALGNAAMMAGHHVRYLKVPDLLARWQTHRAKPEFDAWWHELGKADLLILDVWGLVPLEVADVTALWTLIEERTERTDGERRSVMVCSTAPLDEWTVWMCGERMGKSLLHKVRRNAIVVELQGEAVVEHPPTSTSEAETHENGNRERPRKTRAGQEAKKTSGKRRRTG
jgi:DNA replication protein DnaC